MANHNITQPTSGRMPRSQSVRALSPSVLR